jgi:hypothetical protein
MSINNLGGLSKMHKKHNKMENLSSSIKLKNNIIVRKYY